MNRNEPDHPRNKPAVDVCQRFHLGEGARKLLTAELTTEQYLRRLMQSQQYVDAVRLLAYALPSRQAITWASLCARQYSGANPPDEVSAALDAVARWLAEPNDENRRAAMKAAEQADFGTPAGSAALAVFFSGGSLAPLDAPTIPPAEDLTPNAVAATILLAAVLREPEKAQEKYQAFLAEGLKIAASQ